jgi:AraC-like DNA-binding protein
MPTVAASLRPETRLLPNPARLTTANSVEEAVCLVGPSLSPHTLRVNDPSAQALASLSALHLDDCALVSLKYGFEVDIDAGHILDYFMLKMTLTGEGRIASDDHIAVTSPRSIFITSPRAHTRFRMSAACRHLTTRVCRRVMEERLAQKLGRRLHEPLEFDLEMPSEGEFGRAWWALVAHICDLSAHTPSVLASNEIRAQYSRTIIEMLLHAAPHNYSDKLHQAEAPLSPRHVRRAQDYVAMHLPEIRSVADISAAIGVSTRTLQNGFRHALDMSPADYVRRARIQALHAALVAADPSASVTGLMSSLGITSFGRYAEYYRQQIGVPPSVTLRHAR